MTQIQYLIERNRDKSALIKLLMADLQARIEKLEQESLIQKIIYFPSEMKN